MSWEKPLPIVIGLLVLVLAAAAGGFLVMKKKRGFEIDGQTLEGAR